MRTARLRFEQFLFRGLLARSSASRQSTPALRRFFTSSQPSVQFRPPYSSLEKNSLILSRFGRQVVSRRFRTLRFKSDKATPSQTPNPTSELGSPDAPLSLSQRLRKLSREYGWSAFGVYMALTVLDFPFCFLAVRQLGTERIGHYEHVVVETVKSLVGLGEKENAGAHANEAVAEAVAEQEDLGLADDIEEAEAMNQGSGASIWTELALAYAIHKSFIFLRVPLTAAITPKVVKTLRSWGWNIGKRKPKPKST